MKLKLWTGNLDGRRRGLVISASKERARKVVGAGRREFEDYWRCRDEDFYMRGLGALFKVDTLYTTPIVTNGPHPNVEEWFEGRCPLKA